MPQPRKKSAARRSGLAYWMERVVEERHKAALDFAPSAVHDLRVAIRRCRSMADGFLSLDPDPLWSRMKKAGGRVFRALGELRDVQVMLEWLPQLAPAADPLALALTDRLRARESAHKATAAEAVARFDEPEWRSFIAHLSRRAARVPLEGAAFQYLALERWHEARELHRRALRSGSQSAWHTLRIGIKRFRYTVENFLPERHAAVGAGLKEMQDVLGDIHDLYVLWEQVRGLSWDDPAGLARWHERITAARTQRLTRYREKMVGPDSLWNTWRHGLPRGEAQERALLAKFQRIAAFSHGNSLEAQQVGRVALQLFTGLQAAQFLSANARRDRELLRAGCLLQNIGAAKNKTGHHKRSARRIAAMAGPIGWTKEDWLLTAVVARYHRGAPPKTGHKLFSRIPLPERRRARTLAGIARLAYALVTHGTRAVRVARTTETVVIEAEGYRASAAAGERVAAAAHLLQTTLRRPLVVRPARPRPARRPMNLLLQSAI
jgi:CHAD domain-containing protein